ncbi:WbqC family protein [Pseudomonas sp. UMAB-08]|uniref:WbqC family protein n=1 Tax=Pseudomonas sp. UMAB-08 TaxID=1365375 RepID=UPI001C570F06|nr:WbqC family protein [Pseudomonas sp. UMAB-08]
MSYLTHRAFTAQTREQLYEQPHRYAPHSQDLTSLLQGRVALMQPYFLPYLGYFQLIAAADCFIIYDNVQFIKNGWIERNRYLLDGQPKWFGIPLAKSSHTQLIMDKRIASHFEIGSVLNKLAFAYRRAPYVRPMLAWLEALLSRPSENIAELNEHVLRSCCGLLKLNTPILKASELMPPSNLTGQDRVLELLRIVGGARYLNPVAGGELYHATDFSKAGVALEMLTPSLTPYEQRDKPFVPGLSILDALMFNEPQVVAAWARQGVISRG